jgi:imidazoleglycerol phosphate dehydratase HisB
MNLGITIQNKDNEIIVKRNTKETQIVVKINQEIKEKRSVCTTLAFLDHMIETLAWRANLNIGIKCKSMQKLNHPIAEDTGITIGLAILELFKNNIKSGVEGSGFAKGIIDEAIADVSLSIEGRTNYFIDGPSFEPFEGLSSYDLVAFLEGFCQVLKCTLRIKYEGKDPHHSFEAVFRGLGQALRNSLEKNEWRKGTISAMKGTLE